MRIGETHVGLFFDSYLREAWQRDWYGARDFDGRAKVPRATTFEAFERLLDPCSRREAFAECLFFVWTAQHFLREENTIFDAFWRNFSARAGSDFWRTRNGYNNGFDGAGWADGIGGRLSVLTDEFGAIDIRGDGTNIYFY